MFNIQGGEEFCPKKVRSLNPASPLHFNLPFKAVEGSWVA
jgi:hypothetical protein